MTRPLYIFDLDGTLALIDHRRPILEDTSISKDERWRRFYAACVDDVPNAPIVRLFKALWQSNSEFDVEDEFFQHDIWIWSGRSDEVRKETSSWLETHIYHRFFECFSLRMRPAGDHQTDVTLKRSWLHAMSPEDRARLVLVVDDRDSVVRMWRENGVTCLQCAPGNF